MIDDYTPYGRLFDNPNGAWPQWTPEVDDPAPAWRPQCREDEDIARGED